jgi:hypothetical protein
MTTSQRIALFLVGCLAPPVFVTVAQEGPRKQGSETVARPRKKESPETPEGPKIPSKLGRKGQPLPSRARS